MTGKSSTNKDKSKKKRGCLRPLIIVVAVAVLLIAGFLWLKNPASLVPDRAAATAAEMTASEDKLYILLVGSDENEGILGSGRADTIIAASLDIKTKDLFFISIPRDSYVAIEGYGHDKINHAYAYGGIDLLKQTVEELLNVPIDYYVLIDFAGFEDVIDALGGVEIEVDKRMYYQTYDGLIDIEAGVQRLDGEKALQYVRFRADSLGDITRVSRQQTLMKAIVTEFVENDGYWKLPQLLPAINRAVETDLSTLDMIRLAFLAADVDLETLESATLDGDFMLLNDISYWQIDEAALQETVETHFGGGQ